MASPPCVCTVSSFARVLQAERTAAATEPNLTAESVTLLADDASHDVKNNLSLNAQAVGLMR